MAIKFCKVLKALSEASLTNDCMFREDFFNYSYNQYKCICLLVDSLICTGIMDVCLIGGVPVRLHVCRPQIFVPHHREQTYCRVL